MDQVDSLVKMTDDEGGSTAGKGTMLRNLIMQLRKVSIHPYLFPFAERDDLESTTVEELVATSGKLAVLDKILMSMFKKGNRTCIFSQFTSMLNILEDYCALRGWRYCRFDGGTPRAQRNHTINQFNAPDSDCFIFLMSTRSGGLGINLQTADTCILYDSDWNPQVRRICPRLQFFPTSSHILCLRNLSQTSRRWQESIASVKRRLFMCIA